MAEEPRSLAWWPAMYEPFNALGTRIAEWFSPPSEASSDDADYIIEAELPGVSIDDVDLTLQDGVITLKGEKRSSRQESGESYFFSERRYGAFARSFQLPKDADPKSIRAEMTDGVLNIRIARTTPSEGRQEIAIKPK